MLSVSVENPELSQLANFLEPLHLYTHMWPLTTEKK